MKAAVCLDGEFSITTLPDPTPGPGQLVLNVLRTGICGGDVHLRETLDSFSDVREALGDQSVPRSQKGVVFGHELCGEVVGYGPDTHRRWAPGTPVVALPMLRHGNEPHFVGASPEAPGGYAEQVVVQESMTFPIPNGLPAEHAVLSEPLSVAWHGVLRSRIDRDQTAFVIGCGPIGSAVVAMLKSIGVHTVVASDPSPRRRALATQCGADVVVDPTKTDVFDAAPKMPWTTFMGTNFPNIAWSMPASPAELNLSIDATEALRRDSQSHWWEVFRLMHEFDRGPRGPVVFECAGVPGLLDKLIATAPALTKIMAVAGCMQPDTITSMMALCKEIDILFVGGHSPGEYRDTLHMLADGTIDPAPFVTGTVGLGGIEAAFDALHHPDDHAKVVIDPHSSALAL